MTRSSKPKSVMVTIRHSDGRKEEVTIADAILVYERRRDAATDDVERLHCERRIEELQSRWKKAVRGVERAQTKTRRGPAPSERPTKPIPRRRSEDDTRT